MRSDVGAVIKALACALSGAVPSISGLMGPELLRGIGFDNRVRSLTVSEDVAGRPFVETARTPDPHIPSRHALLDLEACI